MNFKERKSVANNASWIVFGQVIQLMISFFVSTITARYLGPTNFGVINYVASFVTFFIPISSLGLTNIVIKELVDKKEKKGEVIGTCIGIRLISSFLSVIAIIVIVYLINGDDKLLLIVALLQSFSLVFNSFDVLEQWFQTRLESKYTSIARMISYTVVSVYKVFIIINGKTVEWFAFSNTLDIIVLSILFILLYIVNNGDKISFSFGYGLSLIKKSINFILSGMMVVLYGQMDKIMLSLMLNNTTVGYYSTAVYICQLWTFVLNAVINSVSPLIYKIGSKSENLLENYMIVLYSFVFWCGVIVSIMFCLFGKYIILILYGKEYLPAVYPLRIITWYTSFSYLGVVRSIWLILKGRIRYEKYFTFIGAASNTILNLILIPNFGMNGAAIASLVTQIISCFITPFLFRETRESSIQALKGMNLRYSMSCFKRMRGELL